MFTAFSNADINECGVMNGMCQQLCEDTDGSYVCLCEDGYITSEENPLLCNGGCKNFAHLHLAIFQNFQSILTYQSVGTDALCRDGTSEISRDPRTKRLQTRRESLARPSKHTNNNF